MKSARGAGNGWLPENPDDKVAGVLSYDPDIGLLLTLIGGWEYQVADQIAQGVKSHPNETQRWEMIHGRAEGKVLTLLDTRVRRARTFDFARMFEDRPEELVLYAHTALIRCLLESADEPAFGASVVTVGNLTAWTQRGGMTYGPTDHEETGTRT